MSLLALPYCDRAARGKRSCSWDKGLKGTYSGYETLNHRFNQAFSQKLLDDLMAKVDDL